MCKLDLFHENKIGLTFENPKLHLVRSLTASGGRGLSCVTHLCNVNQGQTCLYSHESHNVRSHPHTPYPHCNSKQNDNVPDIHHTFEI